MPAHDAKWVSANSIEFDNQVLSVSQSAPFSLFLMYVGGNATYGYSGAASTTTAQYTSARDPRSIFSFAGIGVRTDKSTYAIQGHGESSLSTGWAATSSTKRISEKDALRIARALYYEPSEQVAPTEYSALAHLQAGAIARSTRTPRQARILESLKSEVRRRTRREALDIAKRDAAATGQSVLAQNISTTTSCDFHLHALKGSRIIGTLNGRSIKAYYFPSASAAPSRAPHVSAMSHGCLVLDQDATSLPRSPLERASYSLGVLPEKLSLGYVISNTIKTTLALAFILVVAVASVTWIQRSSSRNTSDSPQPGSLPILDALPSTAANSVHSAPSSGSSTPETPIQPDADPSVEPRIVASKPRIGHRFKPPVYPEQSLSRKEPGETVIAVCVDADGRTSNARVVTSSGSKRLDDAAVDSLRHNYLEPAHDQNGMAVSVCDPSPHIMSFVWDPRANR